MTFDRQHGQPPVTRALVISLLVVTQAQAGWFHGLGDLPGGDFDSFAMAVSADERP